MTVSKGMASHGEGSASRDTCTCLPHRNLQPWAIQAVIVLLQDIMGMLSRMINMYQMPRISPKDSLTRAALRPAHQAAIGPQPSPIRRVFPPRLPRVQGLFSRPLLGLMGLVRSGPPISLPLSYGMLIHNREAGASPRHHHTQTCHRSAGECWQRANILLCRRLILDLDSRPHHSRCHNGPQEKKA